MSHLSHKIPWHLLVEYFTPYKDNGVSLPVGVCNRIHVNSKKVEIQVKNRNFIKELDICHDKSCETKSEKKVFYKDSSKKKKIFAKGRRDEWKKRKFFQKFEEVVMEFANTELSTPPKKIEYKIDSDTLNKWALCKKCDDFITLLEFGDKKKLYEYSEDEIKDVLWCQHGGQAVGRNLGFLLDHLLDFYLMMNVILHCNLKEEDWPARMKPDSFFKKSLLYRCDGQTFLPHSRKYLSEAMIDLEKSRALSKNLFRFIYFYVLMELKINKDYSFFDDMYLDHWYNWV